MALDPTRNFAKVQVSTGYDHAAVSIVLISGHGTQLPDPATEGAFNLTWWNDTDFKDPADDPNRERVRVTARATDTLTILRAQEGTTATPKNIAGKTYRMTLSWGMINVEQMRNHPLTTKGDIPVFGIEKTRLPVGPDGRVLTARATHPLGVDWEVPGGGGGGITSGWELIRTGTFTTDTNITGLDGDADKLWMLVIRGRHTSGYLFKIHFNNDIANNYRLNTHSVAFAGGINRHEFFNSNSYDNILLNYHNFSNVFSNAIISSLSGQTRLVFVSATGFTDVNNFENVIISGVWANTIHNISTINISIGITITAGEYWLFRQKT